MAQNEVLEKKNEMLKKEIEQMIITENQKGLSEQDSKMKQQFIREMHANNFSLK